MMTTVVGLNLQDATIEKLISRSDNSHIFLVRVKHFECAMKVVSRSVFDLHITY